MKIKLDIIDDWSYNINMDKKLLKKNDILQKSIDIMYQKGFNGTGIQEIVDAAKIPKGSFYNYFKSKEDYAVQALIFFFNNIKEGPLKILQKKELDPIERIKIFYDLNAKSVEKKGFRLGCFIGNLTGEMGDTSDVIARTAEGIHEEISEAVYLCLEEDSIKKRRHSSIDNRLLADFIIDGWQGTLLRMKSRKDSKPLKAFSAVLSLILDRGE